MLYAHKSYNIDLKTDFIAATCQYCIRETITSNFKTLSDASLRDKCLLINNDGEFKDIWKWKGSPHIDCLNNPVVLTFLIELTPSNV